MKLLQCLIQLLDFVQENLDNGKHQLRNKTHRLYFIQQSVVLFETFFNFDESFLFNSPRGRVVASPDAPSRRTNDPVAAKRARARWAKVHACFSCKRLEI